VPELSHRLLIALAWLVRWRVIPTLAPLAPMMHEVSRSLTWGEHKGGMFISMTGTGHDGQDMTRTWHLLAEGDDGPFIPAMAAAAVVRRVLAGRPPEPGARSAARDLDLADFDFFLRQRKIFTGVTARGASPGPH